MRYIPQKQFIACIRYVVQHPEDAEKLVNSTHDGCPYIEIPDKHGRLIDAEELKNLIVWALTCNNGLTLSIILELIDDASTTVLEATK